MTYEPLDFFNYTAVAFVLAVIFMAIVTTIVVSDTDWFMRKPWNFILSIFTLAALGGAAYFAFIGDVSSNTNREVATESILKKYDVKEVEWESKNTTAKPEGNIKEGAVLVTTNAGDKYVFQYEMNKETSEPTLKDMPIQGGNTADKDATADSLLKTEAK